MTSRAPAVQHPRSASRSGHNAPGTAPRSRCRDLSCRFARVERRWVAGAASTRGSEAEEPWHQRLQPRHPLPAASGRQARRSASNDSRRSRYGLARRSQPVAASGSAALWSLRCRTRGHIGRSAQAHTASSIEPFWRTANPFVSQERGGNTNRASQSGRLRAFGRGCHSLAFAFLAASCAWRAVTSGCSWPWIRILGCSFNGRSEATHGQLWRHDRVRRV